MMSLYSDDLLSGDWGDLFAPVQDEQQRYEEVKKPGLHATESLCFDNELLPDDQLASPDHFQPWLDTNVDLLGLLMDVDKTTSDLDLSVTSVTTDTSSTPVVSNSDPALDMLLNIVEEAAESFEDAPESVDITELFASVQRQSDDSFIDAQAEKIVELTPPMSPEEVESLLSSPPCSPNDSSSSYNPLDDSLSSCSSDTSYSVRYSPYSKSKPSTSVQSNVKGEKKKNRKERKKEQNKNAATRYRVKKRIEQDSLNMEAEELESKNKMLRDKVEEMQREIKYLKDLMKDVYVAKGLLKKK